MVDTFAIAPQKEPLILIPGWGEPHGDAAALAQRMAHHLQRTVHVPNYDNLHMPVIRMMRHRSKRHNARGHICMTEHIRAAVVIDFLQTQRPPRAVHIVAHSEGAIAAALVATHPAVTTQTLTLIAPAGITRQSFRSLAMRFLQYFRLRYTEAMRTRTSAAHKYYRHALHYILTHIPTLTLTAYGIARSDITPLLQRIAHTTPVHIITYRNDHLFSPSSFTKCNAYATIHSLDGSHVENHTAPTQTIAMLRRIIKT